LFASFMPSIVAGHLGVKGVVVSGSGNAKIKEFEKQPRGGLGTFARLDDTTKWLRERNSLLKEFGIDGQTRILVCENGACREENLAEESAVKEPLEMSGVGSALPAQEKESASGVKETHPTENKQQPVTTSAGNETTI